MERRTYFEKTQGTGILATADGQGKVDAAVYSRPHVMEDGTLAFIMRDRLTHHNLQSNPQATYLFIENVPGYQGKRLFMTKVREEQDPEKVKALKRRQYADDDLEPKFLVYFQVVQELPLIGSGNK
jgi:Pyridoxamine 5'-phosphate oxidase